MRTDLIPAEMPKDFPERFIKWLAGMPVEGVQDVDRLCRVKAWVDGLDAERKEVNQRLLGLKKYWDSYYAEARDKMIEIVQEHGTPHPASEAVGLRTDGGMVSLQSRDMQPEVYDTEAAASWLSEHCGSQERAVGAGLLEIKVSITSEGRKFLKDQTRQAAQPPAGCRMRKGYVTPVVTHAHRQARDEASDSIRNLLLDYFAEQEEPELELDPELLGEMQNAMDRDT